LREKESAIIHDLAVYGRHPPSTDGVSGMRFIIFWISARYYAIIAGIGMHAQHNFRTVPRLKSHEVEEEEEPFTDSPMFHPPRTEFALCPRPDV
jgi:hypothetical protein